MVVASWVVANVLLCADCFCIVFVYVCDAVCQLFDVFLCVLFNVSSLLLTVCSLCSNNLFF